MAVQGGDDAEGPREDEANGSPVEPANRTRPGSLLRYADFLLGCLGFALGAASITSNGLHGQVFWWVVGLLALLGAASALFVSYFFSVILRFFRWMAAKGVLPVQWFREALGQISDESRRRLRRIMIGAGCVALGLLSVAGITRLIQDQRRGCSTPIEVPVAASPETYPTASSLARAYERSTARQHDGCPHADLSVYLVDSALAQQGLTQDWITPPSDVDPVNYLRDLGPRPQIWMPDSTVEVDRLTRAIDLAGSGPELGRPVIYGGSPLVLAVPSGQTHPSAAGIDNWPELIADFTAAKFQVVSPDPTTSATGQLLLAASYPTELDWDEAQFAAARNIEDLLTTGRNQTDYPLGDATALLREYQEQDCPQSHTALIITEQLATHPAFAGQSVRAGLGCSDTARPPFAVAVPQNNVVLNHPLVPILWDGDDADESDSAAGVAADFGRWLTRPSGRSAIELTGLAPGDRRPSAARNAEWATRGLDPELVGRIDAATKYRTEIVRPAEIMLGLDTSGSMATRLDLGAGVLDGTADRLSDQDLLGLLTFGGDGVVVQQQLRPADAAPDGTSRKAAKPGQSTRDAVRRQLGKLQPGGGTPLLAAFDRGVRSLLDKRRDDAGDKPTIRALVVVTDGRDTVGGDKAFVVADRAQDAGIHIFVVAAGSVDCSLETLKTITQGSDGQCISAQGGSEIVAAKLAAAIWGIS